MLDAISLATYFLVSAAGTREALPLVVVGWGGMCVGAAFLAIAGETGIPSVSADAGDVELLRRHVSWIAPVLELSLVAAVVRYVAAIAAARRLGARRASVIGIAEVLLAVLYERPLLGQLPSAMQFTGGAFMLAGVVLVHVDENQQGRANPLGRPPRRPSLPWSCRHRDARRARGGRRLIYRLISLWLVLLVGWILFLVTSARRALNPRASRPTAVNLTTSTPTDLGGPAVPSDRIAVNLKTLRPACRSRKMSVSPAKLEQRTQDPFFAERTGLPAPSPGR